MFPSIMTCPATCELCGQWMPGHSKDCPRSGVHPSQWLLYSAASIDDLILSIPETLEQKFEFFNNDIPSTRNINNNMIMTDDY